MNTRNAASLLFAFMLTGALGCPEATKPSTLAPLPVTVSLSPSDLTLDVGGSMPLVAIVRNGSPAVTFTSTDARVATVSAAGVVTAVGPGIAVITATSTQDPNALAASTVTVRSVAAITLTPAAGSVPVGEAGQLTATVSGTTNTAVSWSSSANSIATVSVTGVVTGVSVGTAIITATAAFDPTRQATSTITVTPSTATAVTSGAAVTGLSGSLNSSRLYRIAVPTGAAQLDVRTTGGAGDVDLYVRYQNTPDPTTTNSATSCVSDGETTVETCTIANPRAGDWFILVFGYAAYSGVTLTASVGNTPGVLVSVSPVSNALTVGQTRALTATVTNATNLGVTWTSSNNAIASVSTQGVVTAVAVGTATVTARSLADPTKSASATVTVSPAATTALNLSITKAYVVQSVQNGGGIRLVAGKPGLIRAFLTANITNSVRPVVRFRIYNGNTLLSTTDVPSTLASTPLTVAEGSITQTWNVPITAAQVQPGLRIVFDIDPNNLITEADKTDNSVFIAPTVVTLPTFRARFVPIRQSPNGLVGDVTPNNANSYMTETLSRHPVGAINIDVRGTYTTTNVIGGDYSVGWTPILSEIYALQVAEDPSRYFYGVIKSPVDCCGTGLGYVGSPAAIGVDWDNIRAQTVAHEWGHNFNRLHSPCGGPSGPDPKYPYTGGVTGVWGYDAYTGREKPPTFTDLMGYCDRDLQWISDYTYDGVLTFRAAAAGAAAAITASVPEPSLIVWGRVTASGVVLEPSFEAVTLPKLPSGRGSARLEGVDANGTSLFRYAFDGVEVGDAASADERHFAFAIPLRLLPRDRLDRVILTRDGATAEQASRALRAGVAASVRRDDAGTLVATRNGASVDVRWDAQAFPLVVVRDPRTNEILSLARGGYVSVATSSASVEAQYSDGVRTASIILPVR